MTGMGTLRKAIDAFCSARAIHIDSPLAINAAYHVLSIADRERSLAELQAELDEWSERQRESNKHALPCGREGAS